MHAYHKEHQRVLWVLLLASDHHRFSEVFKGCKGALYRDVSAYVRVVDPLSLCLAIALSNSQNLLVVLLDLVLAHGVAAEEQEAVAEVAQLVE